MSVCFCFHVITFELIDLRSWSSSRSWQQKTSNAVLCFWLSGWLPIDLIFGMTVFHHTIQVKFEYQGHRSRARSWQQKKQLEFSIPVGIVINFSEQVWSFFYLGKVICSMSRSPEQNGFNLRLFKILKLYLYVYLTYWLHGC